MAKKEEYSDRSKHKITREQAEYVMGNKDHLRLIEGNVYCGKCCDTVTIANHIFYIDSFGDIILDGKCKNAVVMLLDVRKLVRIKKRMRERRR